MSKYLLDTTVLIDHLRGHQPVVELITGLAQAGNQLAVCSINAAELYSGLSEKHRNIAGKLIDNLENWEVSMDIAKLAGIYRFDFARKGITLSVADCLVAAVAIVNDAVLITANARHYPMDEIRLLEQP